MAPGILLSRKSVALDKNSSIAHLTWLSQKKNRGDGEKQIFSPVCQKKS
jgi:hypothetical protein